MEKELFEALGKSDRGQDIMFLLCSFFARPEIDQERQGQVVEVQETLCESDLREDARTLADHF